MVAFENVFHLKMFQNIFLFFKIYFDIALSKQSKNTKKYILKQKK
jgi:hypothetical protein